MITMISSKLNAPVSTETASRNYFVKKVNRYGIKQKRIAFFSFTDCTFNIETVEQKNLKTFQIKQIKKFIQKGSNSTVVIDFYKEVNAKKLTLVFFSDEEMTEFLGIAQKLQYSLRESKFQAKQSVIFTQDVSNMKDSRKFTWLDNSITNKTTSKNQDQTFVYNVLQSSLMSHEKRYLIFDRIAQEISLSNRQEKVLRKMPVSSLSLRYYKNNPLCVELFSSKQSLELIFPSVYMKYHFASHFFLAKDPGKLQSGPDISSFRARVYVTSWNIGQKAEPTQATLDKLLGSSDGYGIVAMGFQECSRSKFNLWLKALNSYHEQRGRLLLSYISMWDMFLLVYIDMAWIPSISDVQTQKKATGVANIMGNKGGLLLSFRLEDTSFCFVSCHLAARGSRLLVRNQNAKDLLALRPSSEQIEFAVEFDYVFWLGDFNYRIEEDFYRAIEIVAERNFSMLWDQDQMVRQKNANTMYATFQEGLLEFKPTYRLIKDRDEWSNKREQTPSWTDRVIYKAHLPIELLKYQGIDDCYGSDHRPVFACFNTQVRLWYIPEFLPTLNDQVKLGIIEFQHLEVLYHDETSATHGMVSFHSKYLETQPKSSQVAINSERVLIFEADKLPVLSFIFANPEFLKNIRMILSLHLVVVDGETSVGGNTSLSLREVVEFIQKSYRVDENVSFNTNKAVEFEKEIELNSRVVGRIRASWTYNICSREEQYRY
jgi:endonuclease/exonuclease/phosphatase family metal-dependent hydrolase